jgi:hypothetical protein
MNVLSSRVVLRDRTTLDVFDLSLRFLTANIRPFALLSILVLVPIGVSTWFIARVGGWVVGWIWLLSFGMLAQAPFTILASRLVFEPTARIGETLILAMKRIPALFVARTLEIITGSLLSFFVVPTVWIGTSCYFVTEVVVLERSGPITAISRMQRLVSGQFGATLVALLLLVPIHVLGTIAFDLIGGFTLESLFEITAPPSMFDVGGSALAIIGYLVFVPLITTARFLMYLNLRTRSEGWDIQTRFTAIAASGAPVAAE